MKTLDDKVAAITGARGIGRGVALRLSQEGARIVLADVDSKELKKTAELVLARGGEVETVLTNVGVRQDVEHFVSETVRRMGRIDILVNTAQAFTPWVPLEKKTEEDWRKSLESGLFGTLWAMNAAFPHMRQNGGGRIINFASIAGVSAFKFSADYNATKEGIRALSRTAANEWGKYNILVNVICPFADSVDLHEYRRLHPAFVDESIANIPLGHEGDPETEIGGVALFLASNDAKYLTGNTLFVDGGMHIAGPFMGPPAGFEQV